ncbi:unnamed protein product, partial [marine sediment metagenome]
HIIDVLSCKTTQMRFMDANDLMPLIDRHYPELWYGIDADRFPYLRALQNSILQAADTISVTASDDESGLRAPITDDLYVQLSVFKIVTKKVRRKREVTQEPVLREIPVKALLREKPRVIHIVGPAGSGKTTAIRRLAYTLAQKALSDASAPVIPILLKAKIIASNADSLLSHAMATAVSLSPSKKTCFSDDDLIKGNVLILIDALDEAPAATRVSVVNRILRFHQNHPKCQVLLTSRDYTSILDRKEIQGLPRYNLTPFDIQKAQKLLKKVASGRMTTSHAAGELLRQLQDVHGIDLNPLLVT